MGGTLGLLLFLLYMKGREEQKVLRWACLLLLHPHTQHSCRESRKQESRTSLGATLSAEQETSSLLVCLMSIPKVTNSSPVILQAKILMAVKPTKGLKTVQFTGGGQHAAILLTGCCCLYHTSWICAEASTPFSCLDVLVYPHQPLFILLPRFTVSHEYDHKQHSPDAGNRTSLTKNSDIFKLMLTKSILAKMILK